jgi:hypothetical protein
VALATRQFATLTLAATAALAVALAFAFLVVIPEGDLLLTLLLTLPPCCSCRSNSHLQTTLKTRPSGQPFSINTQTKPPASDNTEQETQ